MTHMYKVPKKKIKKIKKHDQLHMTNGLVCCKQTTQGWHQSDLIYTFHTMVYFRPKLILAAQY